MTFVAIKYITLAHQICGSRKSFKGNIAAIMEYTSQLIQNWALHTDAFSKTYPMGSYCTTMARIITYQHLYLKSSMDRSANHLADVHGGRGVL